MGQKGGIEMKVEWEMGGVMVITPETQMELYALEHWISVNVLKKGSVRAGSIAFGKLEMPTLASAAMKAGREAA
jgi:hypothetical protein